jgi:hypothetical protein
MSTGGHPVILFQVVEDRITPDLVRMIRGI